MGLSRHAFKVEGSRNNAIAALTTAMKSNELHFTHQNRDYLAEALQGVKQNRGMDSSVIPTHPTGKEPLSADAIYLIASKITSKDITSSKGVVSCIEAIQEGRMSVPAMTQKQKAELAF